jgi:CRISPR-associated protein Cas1
MKRLLNTLYIFTQGTSLHKEGEAILVKNEGEARSKFPFIVLRSIVCFGDVWMSPSLAGACLARGITITYLSVYGRFVARAQGPISGNVLLRRKQYRVSDIPEQAVLIARTIVTAKILNSRTLLQRTLRDHGSKIDKDSIERVVAFLKNNAAKSLSENNMEVLRGIEGDSARLYFSVFDQAIVAQKDGFKFSGRNRRPPLDRVNALLSFVYTLLYHDMRGALEANGLDPAVGFLHRDRPGRMSLALDLMEEFRSFIADRLVLSMINLRQLGAKDFSISKSGAVQLEEKARKELVAEYQTRKQESIMHPFLKEEMHIGLAFQVQAQLLARYLRGDLDGYPAYVWR